MVFQNREVKMRFQKEAGWSWWDFNEQLVWKCKWSSYFSSNCTNLQVFLKFSGVNFTFCLVKSLTFKTETTIKFLAWFLSIQHRIVTLDELLYWNILTDILGEFCML